MKHRLVRTRESPKNFHDCKELGKNAEVRTLFSEKFLELSLWACPCRRAASCQLCTGKSHGGTQLPLVKNTRNQSQTHTFLSECLINENRSKYFPKTSKGGSRRRWRSRVRKRKKAKSEAEAPLPIGLLPPKHNIMYIEVNIYAKNNTWHTQNYTLWMLLILITSDEKAQKPPHIWGVSIDGQHPKVLQKPKAMRYAFLPKRTGRNKTSPTIASPTSRDCRAEAAATAPQRVHGSQCGWDKPPFLLRPRPQKAASRTAKRANA